MLLVAIIVGAILIVAAIRNSQQTLFSALGQDVPAFIVWGAAILAVGVIGYVRPLKGASDAMLVLIVTVLILNNYENMLKGFGALSQPSGGVTPTASTSEGNTPASSGGTPGAPSLAQAGQTISNASAIINQVATSAGVNG